MLAKIYLSQDCESVPRINNLIFHLRHHACYELVVHEGVHVRLKIWLSTRVKRTGWRNKRGRIPLAREYFQEFFRWKIRGSGCSICTRVKLADHVSISAYKRVINLPRGQQPASVVLCSLGQEPARVILQCGSLLPISSLSLPPPPFFPPFPTSAPAASFFSPSAGEQLSSNRSPVELQTSYQSRQLSWEEFMRPVKRALNTGCFSNDQVSRDSPRSTCHLCQTFAFRVISQQRWLGDER